MPISVDQKNKSSYLGWLLSFPVFLFLFAFALRLAYVFFLKANYPLFDIPSEDTSYYHDLAIRMATGTAQMKDAFWGLPLYPYFLLFVYKFTLGAQSAVRMVHLLLGAFNCVLLYYFVRRAFSENIARVASLLMAVSFLMMYYDWLMNSVTLAITLGLLCATVLLDLPEEKRPSIWFFTGMLLGLFALIDGKAIFVLLLAALYLAFTLKEKRWFRVMVLLAAFTSVVFAVSLRNRIISGSWVFVTAQSGFSLYVGNNPQATGIFSNPDFIQPDHEGQDRDQRLVAEAALHRKLSPNEVSDYWRGKALTFISSDPIAALRLFGNKVRLFFIDHPKADDIDLSLQRDWRTRLDVNPLAVLFPLAILGFFIGFRRRSGGHVLGVSGIFILAQLVFTLIFFLGTKQRVTVYPFLFLGEALALGWLWDKLRWRELRPLMAAVVFVVVWAVVFNQPYDPRPAELNRAWKMGVLHERRGELKKAEEYFLQAYRMSPCGTSSANVGSIYLRQGAYQTAAMYLERAVDLMPQNVVALYNLGIAYEALGRAAEAEAKYRSVLKIMPADLDASVRLIGVLDKQGRCIEAEVVLGGLPSLRPGMADAIREKFLKGCSK